MEGEDRDRDKGFKVQDRRRFSATGDAREDVGEAPAEPAAAPADAGTAEPAAAMPGPQPGGELSFAAFVISLTAQALAHLGDIPDPVERTTHVDLDGARQIIDILGILSEKTRGNLDAAESSLLDNALFDLRMKYVDRAQGR